MIVRNGSGLGRLAHEFIVKNWIALLVILGVEYLIGEINHYSPGFHTTIFSASAVAMLATVVGIFLVFRFDNAYKRWWEARILWGQMVNTSRNFARQVTTLIAPQGMTDQELSAARNRLVYRQIAVVKALTFRLRGQKRVEELAPFLEADELQRLQETHNLPAVLLQQQGRELAALLDGNTSQFLLLTHIDSTLNQIKDVQGGCERIKTTAFPDYVRAVSRVFVWGIAVMIPTVFLEPDQAIYPLEFVAVLFISMAFIIVDQLALLLMDPFENQCNDIPMSTLCRVIERDLREQLGETVLPPQLTPERGVLM